MTLTAIGEPPPSVTGPVTPGSETTFVGPPVWSGHNGSPIPLPLSMCFTVEIRTTSSVPVPWQVVIETDQPPFNNVAPFEGFQFGFFGDATFAPAADYEISGRYLMTPSRPDQYATADQSHFATGCANTPEPAWQPAGPTTYTQQPELTLIVSGGLPCVAATVDGHQPFYVGFTVAFNWKTLLDEKLAASAITPADYDQWIDNAHWQGGPPGYNSSQGATGTDYAVTLQGYSGAYLTRSVYNVTPVTIASCSY